MTRNIFIFLATFVVGALAALVTRAAMFKPYSGHEGHPPPKEYSAMVSNSLTAPSARAEDSMPQPDHSEHAQGGAKAPAADHSAHGAESESSPDKPVNTVCAICGMNVDPSVPTAKYQGKTIGFGCRMCPPKFKADPDKYGPYYLRNEKMKR